MIRPIPIADEAVVRRSREAAYEVSEDLAYKRLAIANVVFVGRAEAGDRGWVLVDAGIPGSRRALRRAAAHRFGPRARPAAIVLTHGHFDHVGALEALAAEWDAPVWAHRLERPYLDGSAAYPVPDPTVGGGLMARISPLYPTAPVNVGARLHDLPDDGSVPPLPGWRWIHTPGHSVGHVSFVRGRDLIAGDAFVTTAQESAWAVARQTPELQGPPAYLTIDWGAARTSVESLASLDPDLVITGHGRPIKGPRLRHALHDLADQFDQIAVPTRGIYVRRALRASDGSAYRHRR